MKVRVLCPHCQARYQVREDKLGSEFDCQKCGNPFRAAATARSPQKTNEETATISQVHIDTTAEPAPRQQAKSVGSRFWKIIGIIVAAFLLSLLIGFLYAPAGATLMTIWGFSGTGLIIFGFVRLFMAMDGQQRFWMALKLILRLFGFKMFYVDSSLWNPRTARAFGWMGAGFALTMASFYPLTIFVAQSRASLKNAIAKNNRKMDELSQEHSSDTFSPPGLANDQFIPPNANPRMPPGGYGFPPPGGMPPAMMPPGARPPGFGGYGAAGAIPIKFFYESFDHPESQISDKVDEAFKSFPFYQSGTVSIDQKKQMIEFTAKYPPNRNETLKIREAYEQAGVHLQPR